MEQNSPGGKTGLDPRITVALISGAVTLTVTMVPLLSTRERSVLFTVVGVTAALVCAVACLVFLYRKWGAHAVVILALAVVIIAASVLLLREILTLPGGLDYAETEVGIYAGSGERVFRDGSARECAFVSPGYLSAGGGAVYLTDSYKLRRVEGGQVSTVDFPSTRYQPLAVRALNADIYVLAEARDAQSGEYYDVFLRVRNGEAAPMTDPLETNAFGGAVADFAISPGGVLWAVRLVQAPGGATATLDRLAYDRDTDRLQGPEWAMDLPFEAMDMQGAGMAFDEDDNLYISVPGQAVVLRLAQGEQEFRVFAGTAGETGFSDSGTGLLTRPTSLAAAGGYLYILDEGTVRRVTVRNGRAGKCETLAGVPADEAGSAVEKDFSGETVPGSQVAFPVHSSSTLTVDAEGRLLLSDPVNGLIYEIRER